MRELLDILFQDVRLDFDPNLLKKRHLYRIGVSYMLTIANFYNSYTVAELIHIETLDWFAAVILELI